MTDQTLIAANRFPTVSYCFKIENITSGGTPVDGTLASGQGSDGLLVPTGYEFHPLLIQAESNAAISAGSISVQVTTGGTELEAGPEATLSSTAQAASATAIYEASSVAAGAAIGLSAEGSADLDAVTKDIDAVLVGVFVPA